MHVSRQAGLKLRVNKDVAAGYNMTTILLQMIANGTRRVEF